MELLSSICGKFFDVVVGDNLLRICLAGLTNLVFTHVYLVIDVR